LIVLSVDMKLTTANANRVTVLEVRIAWKIFTETHALKQKGLGNSILLAVGYNILKISYMEIVLESVKLITRSEGSYRVCVCVCLILCDLENLTVRRPRPE
jgi:hypothetical protein